jgi:hypothetical protein
MGGTFGAALSLAVLFGSLAGNIQERAVRAGLPPEVVDRFAEASALDDTSVIDTLPATVQRAVLEGFADSMSTVFFVVALLLVPAFVLALLVKEIPLRAEGGLAAAHADADQEARLRTTEAESAIVV